MEANTAILVVKSIICDNEQWAVTDLGCEEPQAYKCAPKSLQHDIFKKKQKGIHRKIHFS